MNLEKLLNRDHQEWLKLVNDPNIDTFINYWIRTRCSLSMKKLGLDVERELQDVKQEVWLKIWVQLKSGNITEITTQNVGVIIRSVCTDLQRGEYRKSIDTIPIDPRLPIEDKAGASIDMKEGLERFLSNLSDEDNHLFVERVEKGTSYYILAQDMDLTLWALKTRFVRLKLRLKKELNYDVED